MVERMLQDVKHTVKADSWIIKYPLAKDRKNDECRRIFADHYSEKYADLPNLYDEITEQGSESFYYEGPVGKEFDRFGPVVDIGSIEPFPNTPAAHEEWMDLPNFLKHQKIVPGMVFQGDICGVQTELMHIEYGLAVLTSEDTLIRQLMREHIMQLPGLVISTKKCLKAAIYHILIRMFWPGHSHKVFSDPRQLSKPKEKPPFHKYRVDLASRYARIIWKQERKNLLPELKKLKDFDLHDPDKKYNEKTDWSKEITKCFVKLKAQAGQQHAMDMGFGFDWYKHYFTKEEVQLKKRIEFFDRCSPKTANPREPNMPNLQQQNSDDDDDDDEFVLSTGPPPAKRSKPNSQKTEGPKNPSSTQQEEEIDGDNRKPPPKRSSKQL
jgi:hypothetical protein